MHISFQTWDPQYGCADYYFCSSVRGALVVDLKRQNHLLPGCSQADEDTDNLFDGRARKVASPGPTYALHGRNQLNYDLFRWIQPACHRL